jgi:hypothetical protein
MTYGAVVNVKGPERAVAPYSQVAGLSVVHREQTDAQLGAPSFQPVIHRIPPPIAASIAMTNPPSRREDTPVEPIFVVASIAGARAAAGVPAGEGDGFEREWRFHAYKVCDGHDPEGNVFRLRAVVP